MILSLPSHFSPSLCLSAAIYPATTLTPIGQTLPQPPQVIQQQQQREGEGERTLLLLHFTHLILCNKHQKKTQAQETNIALAVYTSFCVIHK